MREYKHIYGGVYIPIDSGGVNLYDIITEADTTLNLSNQSADTKPTLYITLNDKVKSFNLKTVTIGYSDTANADDLAQVSFYEGTVASDEKSYVKMRYQTGAVAEGAHIRKDVDIPFRLDTAGRVYFTTTWTTAVIDVGASGEYFFIRLDGFATENI